ncbi:MAG TPA: hypothetical protein VF794_04070 [Archangium sp.]|jgi:hypothetical protein|uniref:hypothetical protein n=1 Tax=Archangium sp. TaxID=1872627 RepID=UPI002ED90999
MRILTLALLVLATGCATTGKTAAQRAEEIRRYREQKPTDEAASEQEQASEQEEQPAKPTPPTPPTAPTPPTTPTAAVTPGAPAAPAEPLGPRAGLFGIRATLLGNSLAQGQSAGSSSSLGIRYFAGDSVSVDVNAGFAYAAVKEVDVIGLSLGLGLNIYGGTRELPLRPFFALQGALSQVGRGNTSASAVSLAVGGGAEYWLAPRLSVSASLLLGVASVPQEDAFVIGTFQPGLGVTLYTN